MKIHSDTLDYNAIADAVPNGCYLAAFDHKGFGWTRCGYEGSRKRARGFVVRLSGSSNRTTMDTRNLRDHDKAATWDEWGIFIAAIFERDPNAVVGRYKSHENFILMTQDAYRENLAGAQRPNMTAPWLDGDFPACPSCGSREPDCAEDCAVRMALPRI